MQYDIKLATQVLSRTPGVLRAMLAGLSDEWTHTNYGNDTFSPYDVIGHLITGERTDWLARTRMILEHGTSRPFEPYDRYAQFERSAGTSLEQLLDEFQSLREANLAALDELGLTQQQLALKGTHPKLGQVTLENLLATWVAHDLNHIAQIAKCMATQYADAVGPWCEYLGVLKSPVTPMDADGARRRRDALAHERS